MSDMVSITKGKLTTFSPPSHSPLAMHIRTPYPNYGHPKIAAHPLGYGDPCVTVLDAVDSIQA